MTQLLITLLLMTMVMMIMMVMEEGIYYVLGTIPSSLLVLIHSVFITALWHGYVIILVLFTLFLIGG